MTMTSYKMTHFQNYSRGTIPKAGKSNEHASSTSKEKLKKILENNNVDQNRTPKSYSEINY